MYDLLILGAGWTSTFLLPLLESQKLSFAATTRDGRTVAGHKTQKWSFDASSGKEQFASLPAAKHVLITFPLVGTGQSELLVKGYRSEVYKEARFIQLGSTGIWQIPQPSHWTDRKSPYDKGNKRAIAEDELLGLGGCVLNLAGLWGGERDPRNWVGRVAKSKDDVQGKKSVHLVHGVDVARAVVAVIERKWEVSSGQRWMPTDGFVYDWWSLFAKWAAVEAEAEPSKQSKWVYELMEEGSVKALPRSYEMLGRCYDSREFWMRYGISPLKAGI